MKCPACSHGETKVVDSRLSGDGTSTRRRRECLKCEGRFTTYECVEHVPLMVIKRDGRRQAFGREKVFSGIVKACEKCPVSIDQIHEITTSVEHVLQKKYEREVSSRDIGEVIMEKLAALNDVAYVRFASVYRQFKDVSQFMDELKVMLDKDSKGKE